MLKYEIEVVGAKIGGHPVIEFHSSLALAEKRMVDLKKSFLYNDIVLYEIIKQKVKVILAPAREIPDCPYSHKNIKLMGNVPAIAEGSISGIYICGVCGSMMDTNK
jgi:hypothetical protein